MTVRKKSPAAAKKRTAKKKVAKKTPARKTKPRVEKKTAKKRASKKTPAKKPTPKAAPKKSLIKQGVELLTAIHTGKVGRPTKYSAALPAKIPAMFENGESIAEVCSQLGISHETFNVWRKEKPEFSEAVKLGIQISEAWWSRLGRLGAVGVVDIQPTTWIFNMKNRFDWKDKTETEHSGAIAGNLVIGEIDNPADWEEAAKRQQEIMKGGAE